VATIDKFSAIGCGKSNSRPMWMVSCPQAQPP